MRRLCQNRLLQPFERMRLQDTNDRILCFPGTERGLRQVRQSHGEGLPGFLRALAEENRVGGERPIMRVSTSTLVSA